MDWLTFFEDHGVDYVTRGPNVKKDNVNIACPFCGDDPSHHMGVSLKGKGYGCWRSADHAGKKAHNLIRALLNCSFSRAELIAKQYSSADPETLAEALASLQASDMPDKPAVKRGELHLWDSMQPIKSKGSAARFYHYLYNRGFYDTDKFVKLYNLHCATTGRFKDRIIIPIYFDEKLVSWTSRAIGRSIDAPRYLALSEEQGGLVNVFHTIWNWDELQHGGDILFVVEGPFDALKMDFYGIDLNAAATCTFGTSMSEEQAMMISEVSKGYKRTILLYDEGATEAIFRAKDLLMGSDVEIGFLPEGVEDPGAMSKKKIHKLMKTYL